MGFDTRLRLCGNLFGSTFQIISFFFVEKENCYIWSRQGICRNIMGHYGILYFMFPADEKYLHASVGESWMHYQGRNLISLPSPPRSSLPPSLSRPSAPASTVSSLGSGPLVPLGRPTLSVGHLPKQTWLDFFFFFERRTERQDAVKNLSSGEWVVVNVFSSASSSRLVVWFRIGFEDRKPNSIPFFPTCHFLHQYVFCQQYNAKKDASSLLSLQRKKPAWSTSNSIIKWVALSSRIKAGPAMAIRTQSQFSILFLSSF